VKTALIIWTTSDAKKDLDKEYYAQIQKFSCGDNLPSDREPGLDKVWVEI